MAGLRLLLRIGLRMCKGRQMPRQGVGQGLLTFLDRLLTFLDVLLTFLSVLAGMLAMPGRGMAEEPGRDPERPLCLGLATLCSAVDHCIGATFVVPMLHSVSKTCEAPAVGRQARGRERGSSQGCVQARIPSRRKLSRGQ